MIDPLNIVFMQCMKLHTGETGPPDDCVRITFTVFTHATRLESAMARAYCKTKKI